MRRPVQAGSEGGCTQRRTPAPPAEALASRLSCGEGKRKEESLDKAGRTLQSRKENCGYLWRRPENGRPVTGTFLEPLSQAQFSSPSTTSGPSTPKEAGGGGWRRRLLSALLSFWCSGPAQGPQDMLMGDSPPEGQIQSPQPDTQGRQAGPGPPLRCPRMACLVFPSTRLLSDRLQSPELSQLTVPCPVASPPCSRPF